MNETSTFRRTAATLTIGSFSVAALMGIVALLTGGSFGEGEARVLLTTLIVGCASICMLCYLATSGTRWAPAGVAGALVLVVPVTTALLLVWVDWDMFDSDSEAMLKTFGIGVVAAVTLAQVCMLLALAGGHPSTRSVLWSTVVLATVLAIVVSGIIVDGLGGGDIWRLVGVVAILDVLGTLVTTALSRFGGRRESRVADGVPGASSGVALSAAQARALAELSRASGRTAAELVAEAVDRYVRDQSAEAGFARGRDDH
jgi:F0F1-type ATP synthase assembly protein I